MGTLTYRRVVSTTSENKLLRVWGCILKSPEKSQEHLNDHALNKGKDAVYLQGKWSYETACFNDKLKFSDDDKASPKHT